MSNNIELSSRELTPEDINKQLSTINKGTCFVNLVRPALIGDGIESISNEQAVKYSYTYKIKKQDKQVLKFVPASGAATRMFNTLYSFLKDFNQDESFLKYCNSNKDIEKFFFNLDKFAFYPKLKKHIEKNEKDFESLSNNQKKLKIADLLLNEPFNFGSLPKGLLPFHTHSEKVVTAFEEHFREAVLYASSYDRVNLHFTISKEHTNAFLNELAFNI